MDEYIHHDRYIPRFDEVKYNFERRINMNRNRPADSTEDICPDFEQYLKQHECLAKEADKLPSEKQKREYEELKWKLRKG